MSAVVTVEEIKKEIDKVPVEKLESLFRHIRSLSEVRPEKQSRESFLEKMNKIRFNGPPDFATNIDDYLYGDKELP